MKKAVFFDFNGTLYMDHDLNYMAWKQTIEEIAGNSIDFDKFFIKAQQYMSYQIINKAYELIGVETTKENTNNYVHKKEENYQNLCLKLRRNKMVLGAEELLNYLKEQNIPVILCTSSIDYNVDFYFKNLDLDRWFDRKKVVNDTGEYTVKTDMYLECARRLGVDIKDGVIFEDSPKSIKEAIDTGCPNIIIIKRDDSPSYPQIKQVINDYTELDYSIFE